MDIVQSPDSPGCKDVQESGGLGPETPVHSPRGQVAEEGA